jgi:hypothetical protein
MDEPFEKRTEIRDGISYCIEFWYDYFGDTSYIGEFSDTWEPGAIDRARWEKVSTPCGTSWQYSWDRREYRWFIPGCALQEVRESAAYYSNELGMSRHEAWVKATRIPITQHSMLESYGKDWWHIGISVKAYVNGMEVACASLWGIEDGYDYDPEAYHDEVVEELIGECRHELEKAASKLLTTASMIKEIIYERD